MKNSFNQRPLFVGGSFLLVIYATVCMTMIAILSLSTVKAHSKNTLIALESVVDYYDADSDAEEFLAILREGVSRGVFLEKEDENSVLEETAKQFAIDDLQVEVTGKQALYLYSTPISDTQVLSVIVRLYSDGNYEILQWKEMSTKEWKPEKYIKVYGADREDL